jgi:hypothetical protein
LVIASSLFGFGMGLVRPWLGLLKVEPDDLVPALVRRVGLETDGTAGGLSAGAAARRPGGRGRSRQLTATPALDEHLAVARLGLAAQLARGIIYVGSQGGLEAPTAPCSA